MINRFKKNENYRTNLRFSKMILNKEKFEFEELRIV